MDLNCRQFSTQKPLVSVIVPSYNHANYICQTLESIFSQTYDNIELIVIDDCSLDDSVSVINAIKAKHDFVFIEHKVNKGLSNTLNEAIKIARGKYISSIASDDYWPNYKIAVQVDILENNPEYAVCFGKQIGFNNEGKQKLFENTVAPSGYIFDELITWRVCIPALTAMIRKICLDDVGLYDHKIAIEDWYMWLKLSKKYPFYFIDDYLGYYRLHENNMSKKLLWMVEEKQKILSLWKDEPIYDFALQTHNLMSFWKLSSCNKLHSLKYLFQCKSLSIFGSKYFYRGLIKLMLPCKDYALR